MSLGAARGETPTSSRDPGRVRGPGGEQGAGLGTRVEKGGGSGGRRGDAASPVPPPPLPAEAVSLPTPHSPARVWVGARAAASSRSSVRGAIAPICDQGSLSPAGCVDFIPSARGDADWFPGIASPNGGESCQRVISVRAEGPDPG